MILAIFYALFKVHKPYEQVTALAHRPIASCPGTMMKKLEFMENHTKSCGTSHSSYLQDTSDFKRFSDGNNKETSLPNDIIIVVKIDRIIQ